MTDPKMMAQMVGGAGFIAAHTRAISSTSAVPLALSQAPS